MSGFASTGREARNAFVSVYPFEISPGPGVSLALTTTSGTTSRTALLPVNGGPQVLVTNKGSFPAHIAFGDATIVATTADTCILPGIPYTLTMPEGSTYAAGISDGNTTVQITRGYGN